MPLIDRNSKSFTATVHTSLAMATSVRCDDFASAVVMFDAVLASSATLNFYVSDAESGSYRLLHDTTGIPVSVSIPAPGSARVAFPLPDALFAAAWVKLVPTGSAIDGATCTLTVKS
jgi:hypothetical protein